MKHQSNLSAISLAIDTSSRELCVALSRGTEIIFARQDASGLQQSQRLFPLIEEALQSTEISIAQINNFLVVTGPGSFTGLRAGIASVQGLARSVGKKEFGVSTFDALAYAANIINQPVGIILNASRGDVYFGVREVLENNEVSISAPDMIVSLTELPLKIQELNLRHCLSTMPEVGEMLNGEVVFINATELNLAEVLAAKSTIIASHSNYETALPYYLRLSDAEVNLINASRR